MQGKERGADGKPSAPSWNRLFVLLQGGLASKSESVIAAAEAEQNQNPNQTAASAVISAFETATIATATEKQD